MSLQTTLAGLLLGALGAVGVAHAADQTDSLEYFVGDWNCKAISRDVKGGGEVVVVSTHRHGDWFVSSIVGFSEGKSHKGMSKITYNPYEQKFVQFNFCNEGSYGVGSTPAWDGDSLSFTGYKHSRKDRGEYFKKIFEKVADDTLKMTAQTSQDNQTFETVAEATCIKAQ